MFCLLRRGGGSCWARYTITRRNKKKEEEKKINNIYKIELKRKKMNLARL